MSGGYSEQDNRERRDRERLEAQGYQLLLWSYRRELLGTDEPRPDPDDQAPDQ